MGERAVARFSVYPSKFADFVLTNGSYKAEVEISNESEEKIAFLVLTNSHDDYVVNPKSGFIPKCERVVCTIELRRDGNFHEGHAFLVNVHPATEDDVDRVAFWSKLKGARCSQHRIGVKHPRLDENRITERLQQQVTALKQELRTARGKIEKQSRIIAELRTMVRSCHHPSSLTLFLLACLSIAACIFLLNKMMRGSLYQEAVSSLV